MRYNVVLRCFAQERARGEALIAKYRTRLDAVGHWSMRQRTTILEELRAELATLPTPGRQTHLAVLWTVAACGQIRLANDIFQTLDTEGHLSVGDSSPFDALLKAHTVSSKPSSNSIKRIWSDMQDRGINPTKRTLELLSRALQKAGEGQAAEDIMTHALTEGIPVDWEEGRHLPAHDIEALRHCLPNGDTSQAESIFQNIPSPTPAHWNELLRVYAASGVLGEPHFAEPPYKWTLPEKDPKGLLGVWARYETEGGVPDEWAYHHLLCACAAGVGVGGEEEVVVVFASNVFNEAERKGFAAEQHLWTQLMRVYAAAGDGVRAEELLRRMWESGHNVRRKSDLMSAFGKATSSWLDAPTKARR